MGRGYLSISNLMKITDKLFSPSIENVQYSYWIDVLRGFAAIVILFYHYQHFSVEATSQPWYKFLEPLYSYGGFAVLLFWAISGFVFTQVYLQRQGTGKKFLINRFARLYPLHLLTLFLVAGLQIISFYQTGGFQIYIVNDIYHFFLNIFFISHWGFQDGYSFNAPIWSVSVELLIYAIFWFSLPMLKKRGLILSIGLIALFTGLYLVAVPGGSFWKCGLFFFGGSTLFITMNSMKNEKILLGILSIFLLTLSLFVSELRMSESVLWAQFFGFLGIISIFTILDISSLGNYGKKWKVIGDISYGTYLLHVPVQIVILLGVDMFSIDKHIFTSEVFLAFYVLSVVLLARISFVYFEDPMRRFIRAKLSST